MLAGFLPQGASVSLTRQGISLRSVTFSCLAAAYRPECSGGRIFRSASSDRPEARTVSSPRSTRGSGVQSLRGPAYFWPSLLITCTHRIFTKVPVAWDSPGVPAYSRITTDGHPSARLARTLGPFILLRPITGRRDCLPALRVATQVGLYHPRNHWGPAYSL